MLDIKIKRKGQSDVLDCWISSLHINYSHLSSALNIPLAIILGRSDSLTLASSINYKTT